jgi:hypothetical protein
MAITNASRLADFGSGIGTQGAIIQVDNAGQEVGIGTTNPNATLTVGNIGASGTSIYVHGDGRITGVLTATSFSGDGSNLTGVSGFATALSSTQGDFLNQVFATPKVLPLGAGISVSITSSSDDGNVAFTRAGRVDVGTASTLHVSAGTTFIMNVLNVF